MPSSYANELEPNLGNEIQWEDLSNSLNALHQNVASEHWHVASERSICVIFQSPFTKTSGQILQRNVWVFTWKGVHLISSSDFMFDAFFKIKQHKVIFRLSNRPLSQHYTNSYLSSESTLLCKNWRAPSSEVMTYFKLLLWLVNNQALPTSLTPRPFIAPLELTVTFYSPFTQWNALWTFLLVTLSANELPLMVQSHHTHYFPWFCKRFFLKHLSKSFWKPWKIQFPPLLTAISSRI